MNECGVIESPRSYQVIILFCFEFFSQFSSKMILTKFLDRFTQFSREKRCHHFLEDRLGKNVYCQHAYKETFGRFNQKVFVWRQTIRVRCQQHSIGESTSKSVSSQHEPCSGRICGRQIWCLEWTDVERRAGSSSSARHDCSNILQCSGSQFHS